VTVAGPVYQHLRNMNYVLPVTGSHKAGYVKSGKPLFVATRDGPIHEKMLQSLFDPLMHISHHVSRSTGVSPQSDIAIHSAKQHTLCLSTLMPAGDDGSFC